MLGLDQVQQMHMKQKELRINENAQPVSYYPLKLGKSLSGFNREFGLDNVQRYYLLTEGDHDADGEKVKKIRHDLLHLVRPH